MFNFLIQGILGFISLMDNFIHDIGLTVIFFTIILKILLLPIEFLAFKEEQKIKKIQPKIKEILQNYKDNLEKQVNLLNKLYQEEKYNPFFTITIQFLPLPIYLGFFFALNYLLKSQEINFLFLGLIDLTQKNPFFVLAILILQFLSLKDLPKEQKNFSLFLMGLIIIILFQFPALFSLYWLTNLILTLLERKIFTKFEKVFI
jgi:YidC/Oxa1 family membrane protein insertase